MVLKIYAAPTLEPVTIAEVKEHLRLDTTTDVEDSYLAALITAARVHVESVTNRALVTQTWDEYWDEWPASELLLSRAPLVSVTSLSYTDSAAATSVVSATLYDVDTDSTPGRITLGYGDSWPSVVLHPKNPIAVRYVAGYGSTAVVAVASIPRPIKQALLLLVGHWYESREAVGESLAGAERKVLPFGVDALLANYRVWHL